MRMLFWFVIFIVVIRGCTKDTKIAEGDPVNSDLPMLYELGKAMGVKNLPIVIAQLELQSKMTADEKYRWGRVMRSYRDLFLEVVDSQTVWKKRFDIENIEAYLNNLDTIYRKEPLYLGDSLYISRLKVRAASIKKLVERE